MEKAEALPRPYFRAEGRAAAALGTPRGAGHPWELCRWVAQQGSAWGCGNSCKKSYFRLFIFWPKREELHPGCPRRAGCRAGPATYRCAPLALLPLVTCCQVVAGCKEMVPLAPGGSSKLRGNVQTIFPNPMPCWKPQIQGWGLGWAP